MFSLEDVVQGGWLALGEPHCVGSGCHGSELLTLPLLGLFIPQGFQLPINYQAVDSHLELFLYIAMIFFFNGKCFKSGSCILSP